MTKWEKFFKDHGTRGGERKSNYKYFTMEELYQAFKERLMDDLKVEELEQLEAAEKAFKENV